jgi:hypothetical protein
MHVNTDPAPPPQKPNWRDYQELTTTLLPDSLVMLVPLPELERRAHEINVTHPHLREETPVRVALEVKRRRQLQGLRGASDLSRNQVA